MHFAVVIPVHRIALYDRPHVAAPLEVHVGNLFAEDHAIIHTHCPKVEILSAFVEVFVLLVKGNDRQFR